MIFGKWKHGTFYKFGKNGFLKNGKLWNKYNFGNMDFWQMDNCEHFGILENMDFWKMENLKILEFWKKWNFEKWKHGQFWSVWYQNGTIMVPYDTIWYHYGTVKNGIRLRKGLLFTHWRLYMPSITYLFSNSNNISAKSAVAMWSRDVFFVLKNIFLSSITTCVLIVGKEVRYARTAIKERNATATNNRCLMYVCT